MGRAPDATIDTAQKEEDFQSLKSLGASAVSLLHVYNFGFGDPTLPPFGSREEYGFGSAAYRDTVVTALKAAEGLGMTMDIFIGANQGQGVPVESGTEGLAMHLVYGEVTLQSGDTFDGAVPGPNLGYNHPTSYIQAHEIWGPSKLVAVVAGGVKSCDLRGRSECQWLRRECRQHDLYQDNP